MKIYNLALLLVFLYLFTSPITDSRRKLNKTGATDIVFKSTDGGQTWQDISEGLPKDLHENSLIGSFFADDNGLYIHTVNDGIYHSTPNSTGSFWKKERFPHNQGRIALSKAGVLAYNGNGEFLQKINGTNIWLPVYPGYRANAVFQAKEILTVFETAGGTLFVGSNYGLFKSADRGKTWKEVYADGWVMKLTESNGVLMAASESGILKSTDDGENWNCVLNEGGIGVAIERIEGGFAAINYNIESTARRVRTSYDGGKTWQAIDAGLKDDLSVASIIEVGKYFFCGRAAGIFRSSDKGKTWELLLPSVDNKVFNLFVSGEVIYAVPLPGGC